MSQGRPFFDPDYADLFPEHAAGSNHDVAHDHVPYTRAAQFIHGPLTDVDTLIDRLRSKKEYLRGLIRPPFGRYSELQQNPDPDRPAANFRDPRVPRDNLQDMRMPPYMRDSDEAPLSLTWRQYQELMSFIDYVNATERDVPEHAPPHRRAVARLTRRVARDDRARRS